MQWVERAKRWQRHSRKWLAAGALLLLLFFARGLVWQATVQLLYGMLAALAALPLMRLLEKKCSPSLAASLSLMGIGVLLLALILLLVPPLVRQGRQLMSLLPALWERLSGIAQKGGQWLRHNGLPVDDALRQQLAAGGEALVSKAAPAVIGWARQKVGNVSRWMLAPVFGLYFLKERRQIGEWLLFLVPLNRRNLCVRTLREVCREITGYLRGQLMISLAVGLLTAAGLLLCGIPAWLLLGAVMGIMELIPYVGPFLGGAVVLLFSLEAGTGRMLWALAVVLAVQQMEGSWLSPQLMSDATRLHPVVVLLCIMTGGAVGGVGGILLAVPVLLCLRAVWRVQEMERLEQILYSYRNVKER